MIINNPLFESAHDTGSSKIDIASRVKALPRLYRYTPVTITGYAYPPETYAIDKYIINIIADIHETLIYGYDDLMGSDLITSIERRSLSEIYENIKKAEVYTPDYITTTVKKMLCEKLSYGSDMTEPSAIILKYYLRGQTIAGPERMTVKFNSFINDAKQYHVVDWDNVFVRKCIVSGYRAHLCPDVIANQTKGGLGKVTNYLDKPLQVKIDALYNNAPKVMNRLKTEILALLNAAETVHSEAGRQCLTLFDEFKKQVK